MKKNIVQLGMLLAVFLVVTGCASSGGENDFSIDLAVTQTLEAIAAQQQPAEPTATQAPEAESQPEATQSGEATGLPEDYPAQEACEQMAGWAAQTLQIPTSISLGTFDERSGLKGDGCAVLASTDGSITDVWGSRTTSFIGQIETNGWMNDLYFTAAGIGGIAGIYRNDGVVCSYLHSAGPAENELCNDDEPIWDCMERLPAEDKEYKVVINCTPDQQTNFSGMGPDFSVQEMSVEFNTGTTSQILPGDFPSQAVERFELRASEGQTMTVTLTTDPEGGGVLSVWGEDDTVYLSGKEMLAEWSMVLPKDQIYYVDIKNITDGELVYQVIFDIPPEN